MFKTCLENVRNSVPLIHNITNYVTVNDVANVLLACGASPIMADDEGEVEEITAICSGLNINIGTLNSRTIPSMLKAGKAAQGAGASALRTETARRLIREIRFTIVRGNMSEIKTLAAGSGNTRGVDASVEDVVTEENLESAIAFVKDLSARDGSIVAVTGAIDLVADAERCYVIRNGRPEMGKVTGTGCQLSALTAAYAAANPGNCLEAAAAAVCLMGLAGEIGFSRMAPGDGNAAYRSRMIDAIYNMDGRTLERGAKYEVR